MARRIATWLIRFAVMAVVYVVLARVVIDNAQGWEGLGRLGAAIGFGINIAVVWAVAIGIGLFIPSVAVRFSVHPVLMMLLCLALHIVVAGWIIGTTVEFLWRDLEPFAPLIVGVIILDTIVGFLLERRLIVASRPTA